MKTILLSILAIGSIGCVQAQNIADNWFSFDYIQLPLINVDGQYHTYDVEVEHLYRNANEDSILLFNAREEVAQEMFDAALDRYFIERDSLDRLYLYQLSTWQKNVNAGVKGANGTELPQPPPPQYPQQPIYQRVQAPLMHSDFDSTTLLQTINLAGFEQGANGVHIHLKMHPIQQIRISNKKSGSGSATKYTFTAHYVLPIEVAVSTPSQGVLWQTTLNDIRSYKIAEHKSEYEHQIYMMDHRDAFFNALETNARNGVLATVNTSLNNQFGYVKKSRRAELYAVKSFKSYDYTDVTQAYSLTTEALRSVGADRDRAAASDKLDAAIEALQIILEESTTIKQSRINSKITAMLQCNLAELYIWRAEFENANAQVNLILNSGEGKAKRHIRDEQGFYNNQRRRWEANY